MAWQTYAAAQAQAKAASQPPPLAAPAQPAAPQGYPPAAPPTPAAPSYPPRTTVQQPAPVPQTYPQGYAAPPAAPATAPQPQGNASPQMQNGTDETVGAIHGNKVVLDMKAQYNAPSDFSVFGHGSKVIFSATKYGNGSDSVFVRATVPPAVVFAMEQTAMRFAFVTPKKASNAMLPPQAIAGIQEGYAQLNNVLGYLQGMLQSGALPASQTEAAALVNYLCEQLGQAANKVITSANQATTEAVEAEFTYTDAHPNPYKKFNEGGVVMAPVQSVSIIRKTMRNETETARYPWTVNITNGIAPLREQQGGTVTYDGSRIKDTKTVSIFASDKDILELTNKVRMLTEAFVTTTTAPQVRKAMKEKEERRSK